MVLWSSLSSLFFFFFFFNDAATTEIYTLSLHDALPICATSRAGPSRSRRASRDARSATGTSASGQIGRDTSELQSQFHLVCRLLLEKKKKKKKKTNNNKKKKKTKKKRES